MCLAEIATGSATAIWEDVMNYVSPSEYEMYGLEATTPAAYVAAASALVEAHCRRPTLAVGQYAERVRMMVGSNTVRLSYLPLVAVAPAASPIVAARARFALPRRGERDLTDELAEAVALAFALPGTWTNLDLNGIECEPDTGELTFAINVLGIPFNEVEITYNAGFSTIPDVVKFACAQLVRNAQATPALNVRAENLDRMHLEYFSESLLDETVRRLLAPFVAQKVG